MSAGKGITAEISGHLLYCGNKKYMNENGVAVSDNVRSEQDKFKNAHSNTINAAMSVFWHIPPFVCDNLKNFRIDTTSKIMSSDYMIASNVSKTVLIFIGFAIWAFIPLFIAA